MIFSFFNKTFYIIAMLFIFGVSITYAKYDLDSLNFANARIEALDDFDGDNFNDTLVGIKANGFTYPYYISWYNAGIQKRSYFKFADYDKFTVNINCTHLNSDNIKDILFSVSTYKKRDTIRYVSDTCYYTVIFGQASLKNQDSILIKPIKSIEYSPIVQMDLNLLLESQMKTDFSDKTSYYVKKAKDNILIKKIEEPSVDITTSLGLYPNPSVNSITLELKNLSNEQYRYIITNTLGTIVKNETIKQGLKNYSTDLSTEMLGSGAYFVTIYENDKILILKSFMVSK